MSMNGIDISSWQSGINLAAVPCEFVIVKATEGTTYMNPYCDQTLTQAEELGKKRGVYHYASGLNANEEAEYFVNNIRGYIRKAIMVLDWEVTAVEDQTGWVKRWLDRVYQLTGVKPFIYMSNYMVNDHDWGVVADAGYRLWNAYYYAYGTRMGYNPDAPLPEKWEPGRSLFCINIRRKVNWRVIRVIWILMYSMEVQATGSDMLLEKTGRRMRIRRSLRNR